MDKNKEPKQISDSAYPMSEERRQQMLKYHEMSDEEILPICKNWTKKDWLDYHLCYGGTELHQFMEENVFSKLKKE